MRLSAIIKIAWKNLWAHRLRTILTMGGVSLGVAAVVFLVSLGYGLERMVTSQVADYEAFTVIDVTAANLQGGKLGDTAIEYVDGLAHVVSVDEVADVAGRVRLKEGDSTTETIIFGVSPGYSEHAGVELIGGMMPVAENQIAINETLAGLLGLDKGGSRTGQELVGDIIIPKDLRISDGSDQVVIKERIPFVVVGVVQDAGNPSGYVSISALERQGVVGRTSLKVKVDTRDAVDEVRMAIENSGLTTEYIGDTVDQINQVFGIFRLLLGGLGLIALVVAGLGTFNTMTISLMERVREVGLLKTLGIRRKDIFKLFMAESLTVGVIGGLLGILTSSAVGWGINTALTRLASQGSAVPVTVYFAPAGFIAITAALSLVTGFLTGLYPAIRAIRTNALDVLRYE